MADTPRYQFAFRDNTSAGSAARDTCADERGRVITDHLVCSPCLKEGVLVVDWFEAERGSIVSQIALRLSREAMLSAAIELGAAAAVDDKGGLASAIVRKSFKDANEQVYQYAHRMAAGGKAAARAFCAVFDGIRLSIGKVGPYASYLCRGGRVELLHQSGGEEDARAGILQRFIGANAQILVDLASAKVEEGDTFVLTTVPHTEDLSVEIGRIIAAGQSLEKAADEMLALLSRFVLVGAGESKYVREHSAAVALVHIGRQVIKLTHVLQQQSDDT